MITPDGKVRVRLAQMDCWEIMKPLNYEEKLECFIQLKKKTRRLKHDRRSK